MVSQRARDVHAAVDRYLPGLVEARALEAALRLGVLVGVLNDADGLDDVALAAQLAEQGSRVEGVVTLNVLMATLGRVGVVERGGDPWHVTEEFGCTFIDHGELLRAKLEVGLLAAADIAVSSPALIEDIRAFSAESRTYRLFDYERSAGGADEAVDSARSWVRYLTSLSRYEAPEILDLVDHLDVRTFVDIGGNVGEFAAQLCRGRPAARGTVVDLPAVAAVAREHLASSPDVGDRITVQAGDARYDPLPGGADLVVMKSFLHDWADPEVGLFLRQAHRCLRPGGTLLVAEREPFEVNEVPLPFASWPMLLFTGRVRGGAAYPDLVGAAGFVDPVVRPLHLDGPWFVLTATAAGAG